MTPLVRMEVATAESVASSSTGPARFRRDTERLESAAFPNPSPMPSLPHIVRGDMEAGFGFSYVRFRSSQLNGNLYGPDINFTYFVAPWIGVDVNVASDFAPQSSSAAITRSVSIGSGVKVISSRVKTVRPWAHVLLGRICCTFPQTAFGNSGFAAEVGGGVDLPLHYSWLALRLGSDYFRSQLYAGGQNNVRVNVGVVYHF